MGPLCFGAPCIVESPLALPPLCAYVFRFSTDPTAVINSANNKCSHVRIVISVINTLVVAFGRCGTRDLDVLHRARCEENAPPTSDMYILCFRGRRGETIPTRFNLNLARDAPIASHKYRRSFERMAIENSARIYYSQRTILAFRIFSEKSQCVQL